MSLFGDKAKLEADTRKAVNAFVDAGVAEPYVRSDGMPGLRRTKWAADAGFDPPASQQAGDPDGS